MAARKISHSSTPSTALLPLEANWGLNFARKRQRQHSDLSLSHALATIPSHEQADVPASSQGESLLLCLCISLAINRKQPALDSLNKNKKKSQTR